MFLSGILVAAPKDAATGEVPNWDVMSLDVALVDSYIDTPLKWVGKNWEEPYSLCFKIF